MYITKCVHSTLCCVDVHAQSPLVIEAIVGVYYQMRQVNAAPLVIDTIVTVYHQIRQVTAFVIVTIVAVYHQVCQVNGVPWLNAQSTLVIEAIFAVHH